MCTNFLFYNLKDSKAKTVTGKPVTHWRSKVTVNVMEDEIAFDRQEVPGEIMRYLRSGL